MRRTLPRLVLVALALPLASPAQDDLDRSRVEEARRRYPPHVTGALLEGRIDAPAGFDERMTAALGAERLAALRAGRARVEGRENDRAALALADLGVAPESLAIPGGQGRPAPSNREVRVRRIESSYEAAPGGTSGSFRTGQDADLALSAIGFDSSGGPLLFNHPMGIASDGKRLLLADTYNHRVLVWKTLPEGNVPPDLVLGQRDFDGCDSGDGRDQLNWPVQVATDGVRVYVADTNNDRILIWNRFPESNGVPADVVLSGRSLQWPWGLWTDGKRLAITSTRGGAVLVWNRIPTADGAPADLVLTGGGKLGTPRTITSDGRCLIVGDHNPRTLREGSGTFFWTAFPARSEEPYDFFRTDPAGPRGPWLRGAFAPDGRLVLVGSAPTVWDRCPRDAGEEPDLVVRGWDVKGGDHVGAVVAGGRLYVCCGNRNLIAVWDRIPERSDERPAFAIGSPDLETDTLQTNFIISNPVPVSNGKSLFVASDFDRKLYVWRRLPDASGVHPDLVYDLPEGPWDAALWKDSLVLAGRDTVTVWRSLPTDGRLPDAVLSRSIGGARLEDLRGVALDDRYLYLADHRAGRIHVWKGIPGPDDAPAFSLAVDRPWRIHSDGEYLAVAAFDRQEVDLFRVADLGPGARPGTVGGRGRLNLPSSAATHRGRLFVADNANNRVLVWNRVEDALAGRAADAVLGQDDDRGTDPGSARDRMHFPAAVSFDGSYLWVGETKFSERLLRFSPREAGR